MPTSKPHRLPDAALLAPDAAHTSERRSMFDKLVLFINFQVFLFKIPNLNEN
jgi:hypothetical protein